nr:MAG TPA: hypothetical protein [Caudoviricetes sp.]
MCYSIFICTIIWLRWNYLIRKILIFRIYSTLTNIYIPKFYRF